MTPSFSVRSRLICSVSPFKLPRLDRPYGPKPVGGMSVFEVKPYTLEDRNKNKPPHIVPLTDCFQAQRDVWQGIGYPGQATTPQFIQVEKIAADIMTHWAVGRLGAPSDSGPGVFLAAGEVPTVEEVKAAFARQELYMVFLYEKALEYFNNKELVNISQDHRLASNWLQKDEIWSKTGAELSSDRCPFCQTPVSANAFVCAACRNPIRELTPELAKLAGLSTPVPESKQPRPVAR